LPPDYYSTSASTTPHEARPEHSEYDDTLRLLDDLMVTQLGAGNFKTRDTHSSRYLPDNFLFLPVGVDISVGRRGMWFSSDRLLILGYWHAFLCRASVRRLFRVGRKSNANKKD
jgi:hypothetical protein